jgi:hypothetical protein
MKFGPQVFRHRLAHGLHPERALERVTKKGFLLARPIGQESRGLLQVPAGSRRSERRRPRWHGQPDSVTFDPDLHRTERR